MFREIRDWGGYTKRERERLPLHGDARQALLDAQVEGIARGTRPLEVHPQRASRFRRRFLGRHRQAVMEAAQAFDLAILRALGEAAQARAAVQFAQAFGLRRL